MTEVIFGLLDESRVDAFFENKLCSDCQHMLREFRPSRLNSELVGNKKVLVLKCVAKLPCWVDTEHLKFNVVLEDSEIKECAAYEKQQLL